MAKILPIVDRKNPILRVKAKSVPPETIRSPEIQTLIDDMRLTLDKTPDGVGLAAPQVGLSWRIFIVKTEEYSGIFINPEIINITKNKLVSEEGCLSIRGVYGLINRAKSIKVRALNEKGKTFKFRGKGFLARVIQHELDHLESTLFIDKAEKIYSSQSSYERS